MKMEQPFAMAAWTPRKTTAALLIGAVTVLVLAAQLALNWRQASAGALEPGPLGGLYSVQLVNGQIYYGTLLESRSGFVRLGDIYYTQAYTLPNGQPGNRVVNRRKTDWHGPEVQLIPVEKILMMEKVGGASQLAKLIAQDQALP